MRHLLVCMSCVLALAACESSAPAPQQGPPDGDILIGSDLPTSGFEGNVPPLEQAIQLAIDQHQRIGRFKLAYWPLDNAVAGIALPEKGLQNLGQFIDDPKVLGVISPFTSSIGLAEIPVGNGASMAMVSPTATSACLTRSRPDCYARADALRPAGPNNFFRIAAPEPLQGTAMARYMVQNMHLSRAAVLNEMGPGGAGYADNFRHELTRLGGEVVFSGEVASGTTDFSAFMGAAKERRAQAIFALGGTDDKICVAAAQMPPGIVFLGTDNFTTDDRCQQQAGSAADGIIGTLGDVDATKLPAAAAIVKQYRERFPRTNDQNGYVYAAYDATTILIAAIQYAVDANGGKIPSRAQVVAALARTSAVYQGATGTYSFDANGDAKSPMMSIYEVENGQWTFVQKLALG